jgi:hypothetical protein
MKVNKPDEVIRDAIKLADLQAGGKGTASPVPIWSSGPGTVLAVRRCAALFDGDRSRGVSEMIERWPKAWNRLREGGRGKFPRSTVAAIGFDIVGDPVSATSAAYDASIRIVRVWPETLERQEFDLEGWPVGIDAPPSATPMSVILEGGSPSPVGVPDPCHGYLWLERSSQARLGEIVPALDPKARACLRGRLMNERNWSEAELAGILEPPDQSSSSVTDRCPFAEARELPQSSKKLVGFADVDDLGSVDPVFPQGRRRPSVYSSAPLGARPKKTWDVSNKVTPVTRAGYHAHLGLRDLDASKTNAGGWLVRVKWIS